MSDDADVDATLDLYTKNLRPNHYAALVTKVTRRSAEIYVQGRNAKYRSNWPSGPIHHVAKMECVRRR